MRTDITQVMVKEHQLILRMIALLEKNVALMEQGRFRNWQFFLDAVDFIRNYADRFHHAKEEDVLFVALINNGMPEKQSPIEAMHIEHDQGRAFVRNMADAAEKALAGEAGQIGIIAENANGYIDLLREHIDKEDTVLYPLAERILPDDVRAQMVDAYHRAEEQTLGLEEKYQRLLAEYERQAAA
ncbi:hemerythrin domain-containing protein [Pelovirga terrestris]|uniref:Hemerythrin domain-containing protein n=1 Tax=Pelovirga terrestris TaxID=2771352 RepID=A0A8J6QLY6_9BACT|nr:hemerythrin domain-containing protein [Pelovirga terrestris]MBD1399667.1 hemerythrin domain-containing protein [Pelovirga terrestris]